MRTEQLTRKAPAPLTAPERPAGRVRPVAAALLGLALVGGAGAWAGGVLDRGPRPASEQQATAADPRVAAVGTAVRVPGGRVTVAHVEHVAPGEVAVPLPAGTHAVEVDLSVVTEPGGAAFDPTAVRLKGEGVPVPIPPTSADPATPSVGPSQPVTLRFVVPDRSTDLVLVFPGGGLASAEHANHPGDAAPSAG